MADLAGLQAASQASDDEDDEDFHAELSDGNSSSSASSSESEMEQEAEAPRLNARELAERYKGTSHDVQDNLLDGDDVLEDTSSESDEATSGERDTCTGPSAPSSAAKGHQVPQEQPTAEPSKHRGQALLPAHPALLGKRQSRHGPELTSQSSQAWVPQRAREASALQLGQAQTSGAGDTAAAGPPVAEQVHSQDAGTDPASPAAAVPDEQAGVSAATDSAVPACEPVCRPADTVLPGWTQSRPSGEDHTLAGSKAPTAASPALPPQAVQGNQAAVQQTTPAFRLPQESPWLEAGVHLRLTTEATSAARPEPPGLPADLQLRLAADDTPAAQRLPPVDHLGDDAAPIHSRTRAHFNLQHVTLDDLEKALPPLPPEQPWQPELAPQQQDDIFYQSFLQALQGVDLPEEEDDDFDFANEISLPDLPEDDGSLHVPVTRMRAARGDESCRGPTPEHAAASAAAAAAPQQVLQAVFAAAEPPQQKQRASATATGLGHATGAAQQPGRQTGQQQGPNMRLAAARRSGYWPPDAEEAEAVGSRQHLAAITAAALERRPYLYAAARESKNPTMLKEVWTPPQHLHLDGVEAPVGFTQPQLALLHGQIHAHTQLLLQLHAIAHGAPGLRAVAEFTGTLLKELQARYWMVLQEGDPLVGMGPRLHAEAYHPATLQLAGAEGLPAPAAGQPALQLAVATPALQLAVATPGLSAAALQQDGAAAEQSTAPAWQPAAGVAEVAQLPGAHEAGGRHQAATEGLGALVSLMSQQQKAPTWVSTQHLPSTSLRRRAPAPAGGSSKAGQAPGSQQGPGSAASCSAASTWRTGASGFRPAGGFAVVTILDVMPLRLVDSILGKLFSLPQIPHEEPAEAVQPAKERRLDTFSLQEEVLDIMKPLKEMLNPALFPVWRPERRTASFLASEDELICMGLLRHGSNHDLIVGRYLPGRSAEELKIWIERSMLSKDDNIIKHAMALVEGPLTTQEIHSIEFGLSWFFIDKAFRQELVDFFLISQWDQAAKSAWRLLPLLPQLKLQHRHGAKLHDIYWNQTLGIKRHGHFAQPITKWKPSPEGLPSRAAVLAVAAAHATSSYAVVEQMIQDQEAEDAYAYSQWDQDSDPAKIAAGIARAMRRSGRSGQRQIAFLFPGSEDMPALLEARRLAAEAASRAAQQSQSAVERSQPARLEWPQGPALARPHQSAGLLAEGSSAAQPGHLCMGSASNQAQVPAAEPGASLRDIAGMLARRRLPCAAPRGPSEAQPPRAGMQSLANMLAHRQQPLRPLSSASDGQMQANREAAPQRLGYALDAPPGAPGLATADARPSCNAELHSDRAVQATGLGTHQQAQAPAQASTARLGHLSSSMSGHAALPAGAAPVAAPAPPAPGAPTLPDSQEEGQSRAQSQDGAVADASSHGRADVPAQQALRVPVVALQHGAADWQRADMLHNLADREAPAPWAQHPASKKRPLAELIFTDKATTSQTLEDTQPELPGCQQHLTVEQASQAMLHLAGTQPLQPAAVAENLHLLVAALEQSQSTAEPGSGQAAADGDSPAAASPPKRRRQKAQVCRTSVGGESSSDERLADSSDEEAAEFRLSRPAKQAAKQSACVPKNQQADKQRRSRSRAAKQRRCL